MKKDFPKLDHAELLRRLNPPTGPVSMVLDTDTYNEIDDQYAVVYALRSPAKLAVEAIYAAPFHNQRSASPGDGMQKSFEEIQRVLGRIEIETAPLALKGSDRYLPDATTPVESEAARDLVERAHRQRDGLLYVVPIGAITNVASAILLDPSIVDKLVVVWLGGNSIGYHTAREFNLMQDFHASRLIFDCGVPLVHVPCIGVTEMLRTTRAELGVYVKGRGPIGDYLYDIYCDYVPDKPGQSKVIWDMAPIAWLLNPDSVATDVVPSPVLNAELTWSVDSRRHPIRTATHVDRDWIFADFFRCLPD
jgi:purine nucleosidase